MIELVQRVFLFVIIIIIIITLKPTAENIALQSLVPSGRCKQDSFIRRTFSQQPYTRLRLQNRFEEKQWEIKRHCDFTTCNPILKRWLWHYPSLVHIFLCSRQARLKSRLIVYSNCCVFSAGFDIRPAQSILPCAHDKQDLNANCCVFSVELLSLRASLHEGYINFFKVAKL